DGKEAGRQWQIVHVAHLSVFPLDPSMEVALLAHDLFRPLASVKISLQVHFTSPLAIGDAPYCPATRIALAVCVPIASAASTVPISRPAYNASAEKNTVPASNFRSAVCASRVLGVA